ncbi:DUF5389 domain-containing protein [Necropsobacter rosorum]|uniref:DUF5389 domain-containing protein n=1 Tax=Necropsobacter rosorum TaxID=908285 RepID=UPI0005096481
MKKQNMPNGFSAFSWALAGFCLPILLWPLALLISPNLLKNPALTDLQAAAMSVFLWLYPVMLGVAARVIYRLHQRNPSQGKRWLAVSAAVFYLVLCYVALTGFH